MPERWSWKRRKRFFFAAKLAAWVAYLATVLVVVFAVTPGIFAYPLAVGTVVSIFVAMPAAAQLVWIFCPGFFYVSRLRFNHSVRGHVSPDAAELGIASGQPAWPNLRNLTSVHSENAPVPSLVLSVRTDWDQWLFVALRLLGVQEPGPATSSAARLVITHERFALSAGYWRPGVVLELPTSRIVGIWKGSEIRTIGDRRVLVLVLETDSGPVILPFQVHRWSTKTSHSRDTDELILAIEGLLHRVRQPRLDK